MVSLSTMEAEYVAASEIARELLCLKQMILEMKIVLNEPMNKMIDNEAAIARIENEASSSTLISRLNLFKMSQKGNF